MNPLFFRFGVVLSALIFSSCATMFGPGKDTFTLDSVPQGATVLVNGHPIGVTPLTTSINRMSGAVTLTFRKAGYQDFAWNVPKSLEGWTFINLGFISTTSGATSFGIDALSGKMFRYSQTSYVAELAPAPTARLPQRSALEYAIERFEPLQREFSRSDLRGIHALCEIWSLDVAACKRLKLSAGAQKERLARTRNGLELYRELERLTLTKS